MNRCLLLNKKLQITRKNCWKRACTLSCASESADYLSKLFTRSFSKYFWIVGMTPGNVGLGKKKRRAYVKKKSKISKLPHRDFSKLSLASSIKPFKPFAPWFSKLSNSLWQSWRRLCISQERKFEEFLFHKYSHFDEFFLFLVAILFH